jgi:hypothetical protein
MIRNNVHGFLVVTNLNTYGVPDVDLLFAHFPQLAQVVQVVAFMYFQVPVATSDINTTLS